MVLLSKFDERFNGIELSTNEYPGVAPQTRVTAFARDPFPRFTYDCGVRKTIAMIHGEPATVVVYEADVDGVLELRPFIAARDYHSLQHANDAVHRDATFVGGIFRHRAYDGVPELAIAVPHAEFVAAPDWYYRFVYAEERERGLDFEEDLFTPGTLRVTLRAHEPLAILISTEDVAGRDALALLEQERARRSDNVLHAAADQFIVRRGDDLRTIIAGYHWFTDWGRDTMISLPGLCLVTGRHDDARRILAAFAANASQGMLPNRFPDAGEVPEYNTADATLWLFIAAKQYLDATDDDAFVREHLVPLLRDVVQWHLRGTRHGIHVDDDGLLVVGEQLTWMDARIGDWVVTPRSGKPVEINALWYNALRILAQLERSCGFEADARALDLRADRTRTRFRELFWSESRGYLYDVVAVRQRDASLRPNQLFAISLPHPLIEGTQAARVLEAVERKLLTPFGLRTLSPDDPRYVGRCTGDQRQRDGAYHQGTVWPWLFGAYVTAMLRVRNDRPAAQKLIDDFLAAHLNDAGIGTISEIFDGDAPHTPRGCIAQAWSVAEVLRIKSMLASE